MTSPSAMPLLLASAGLTGRFPDVLPVVAAKFQTLELRNTSLLQCNASHILALDDSANGTVGSLCISCQVSVADCTDLSSAAVSTHTLTACPAAFH